MGVDARMLVKVPNGHLTEQDVDRLSYEIAATIGAGHFFITKGDPEWTGREYQAITLITPQEPGDECGYPEDNGKVLFQQDGPSIYAAPGEQFLNVGLQGRYYHEEYARGDWPVLRAVIEWFWLHLPEAEVWYGGDSSGACAELMTRERVEALNEFFLTSGRRTYTGFFSNLSGHDAPKCACSGMPMTSSGGGRGMGFWFCDGCNGTSITSEKAPQGVRLRRHEGVFDGCKRLEAEGLI